MASNVNGVRAAIEGRIEQLWGTRTPLSWPDRPYRPAAVAWMQVGLLWGRAMPLTMGPGGLNGTVGLVNLNLYDLASRGQGNLTRLAEFARTMLAEVQVAECDFDVPGGPVTVEPTERWRQVNVSVTFVYRGT